MGFSKVEICNIALASVGAERIRAIDEDNERASMCDTFYDMSRSLLLAKFDWPFARKTSSLSLIDPQPTTTDSELVYVVPADCVTPRNIGGQGSKTKWRLEGPYIYTPQGDASLVYTALITTAGLYSNTFANLLSLHLAMRICMPLTADRDLFRSVRAQFKEAQAGAWESDANIGSDYRNPYNNPDIDTFVEPDGVIDSTEDWNY